MALTAPYGHDGAYNTLRGVILHHLDPVSGIEAYNEKQAVLPPRADLNAIDFIVQDDPARRAVIAASNELAPVSLTNREIRNLIYFLHALTDTGSIDLRNDVPKRVPSGLPLAD